MIFWAGKHKGSSIELVRKIDPGYISWCEENAPNMLKEKKKPVAPAAVSARKEPPEDSEVIESSLKPNLNFLNEKSSNI